MADKPEWLRAEARRIREQAGLTSFAPDRAILLGMAEGCEREAARAEASGPGFLPAAPAEGAVTPAVGAGPGTAA